MAVKVFNNGEDLQTAVFGGRSSNSVLQYMQHQIQQYAPFIKDDSFMMQGVNKLLEFTSEAYQRSLEAVSNMLSYNKVTDSISFLDTLESFQNAVPTMQRYIMAHTPIRTLYLNGVLDGYAGSYENIRGDAMGEDLFEWRRMNSGLISFEDKTLEDGEVVTNWVSTTYYDKIPEGDNDLTFDQRCIMKDTLAVLDKLLQDTDSDMTSRLNNSR